MPEQQIEHMISQVLTGDAQKNVFEFVAFLRANEMLFERGKGYWEDKSYWMIKYKDEYVCFILMNSSGSEEEFASWTIWSDDSGSNWFEDSPLDEQTKEIAWKHVDFCGACGGDCSPGTHKTIFGEEFHNVCRTTFRFINPDADTLECVKKMVEIRKDELLRAR